MQDEGLLSNATDTCRCKSLYIECDEVVWVLCASYILRIAGTIQSLSHQEDTNMPDAKQCILNT